MFDDTSSWDRGNSSLQEAMEEGNHDGHESLTGWRILGGLLTMSNIYMRNTCNCPHESSELDCLLWETWERDSTRDCQEGITCSVALQNTYRLKRGGL